MDMVKKYFPQAFKANDVKSLIIALLIYAVIAFVGGLVIGLLGIIPIIGFYLQPSVGGRILCPLSPRMPKR